MAKTAPAAPQAASTKSKVPFNTADLDEDEVVGFDVSKLPPLPAEFGDAGLVTVVTGFAPYWEPKEAGRTVFVIPRAIDFSDPAFVRITCENLGEPLECHTGAKGKTEGVDESTPVMVGKGELFTIGWYASLPLEYGLKDSVPIAVHVIAKERLASKTETGEPKKLWKFAYMTGPQFKPLIEAEKARAMRFGPRNIKTNPNYLLAFTGEGLQMSAPPAGMAMGGSSSQANGASANAEA